MQIFRLQISTNKYIALNQYSNRKYQFSSLLSYCVIILNIHKTSKSTNV